MKRLFDKKQSKSIGGKSMGFTLMEVLVTIVIISIGLLGVASLQFNSLRSNQGALESSIAASLAAEGADRLRANLPGIRNDDSGVAGTAYDMIDAAGSDPGCIAVGCSIDQIAQTDAYQWITKIERHLPSGVGVICRDTSPGDGRGGSDSEPWDPECNGDPSVDVYAVKVAWDHDTDPETPFSIIRLSVMP
ncbi:MAG: type IV pilus modification protein PilV [Candidatus Thiodiazotropha sp. (ex Monitilora ramsayi)]|nr:type IV pilus modification protein PilV [Candidatus Thiodiazotropha sp. (ex Monitilora ramsayi)]